MDPLSSDQPPVDNSPVHVIDLEAAISPPQPLESLDTVLLEISKLPSSDEHDGLSEPEPIEVSRARDSKPAGQRSVDLTHTGKSTKSSKKKESAPKGDRTRSRLQQLKARMTPKKALPEGHEHLRSLTPSQALESVTVASGTPFGQPDASSSTFFVDDAMSRPDPTASATRQQLDSYFLLLLTLFARILTGTGLTLERLQRLAYLLYQVGYFLGYMVNPCGSSPFGFIIDSIYLGLVTHSSTTGSLHSYCQQLQTVLEDLVGLGRALTTRSCITVADFMAIPQFHDLRRSLDTLMPIGTTAHDYLQPYIFSFLQMPRENRVRSHIVFPFHYVLHQLLTSTMAEDFASELLCQGCDLHRFLYAYRIIDQSAALLPIPMSPEQFVGAVDYRVSLALHALSTQYRKSKYL